MELQTLQSQLQSGTLWPNLRQSSKRSFTFCGKLSLLKEKIHAVNMNGAGKAMGNAF